MEAGAPDVTWALHSRLPDSNGVTSEYILWGSENVKAATITTNETARISVTKVVNKQARYTWNASTSNNLYGKSVSITPLSLTSTFLIRY